MIELSFESLAAMVALVILLGSLIGSSVIYMTGGNSGSDGLDPSNPRLDWRPANSGQATPTYVTTGGRMRAPRRRPSLSLLAAGGLAALGATAGYTMYQSPWPLETDLRHHAATLHCDLAEKVGLAPAHAGEPGYHQRNDRDGNGVSCEIHTAAAVTRPERKTASNTLATPRLVWPAGVPARQ